MPPSRRLRLFGVNLDCGPEPEAEATTPMYVYTHQSPYANLVQDHIFLVCGLRNYKLPGSVKEMSEMQASDSSECN